MICCDCRQDLPLTEFQRSRGINGSGEPAKPRMVRYCKSCGFDRRSSGRTVRRYGIPDAFRAWVSARRRA